MSLLAFLRSHAVRVVCSVLVLALLAAMLPVVGVERAAMELVVLLVAVLELVGLLWEWLRGRSFMRSLAGLAGGEEDVLDAVDTIPEPGAPSRASPRPHGAGAPDSSRRCGSTAATSSCGSTR